MNLLEEVSTFGRSTTGYFEYKKAEHKIDESVFGQISNKHFSILKNDLIAYLVDHSRHGTFVNGVRVTEAPNGKCQILLKGCDKISVVSPNGPCKFIFLCMLFSNFFVNYRFMLQN